MGSRSEEVKIVVSAQDQTAGVLGGIQKQILAIGAAYLSFNAAKTAISYIVTAGMEAEAAWNDVAAALKRHGLAVDENLRSIQNFSSRLQQSTGENDEAIGQSMRMFIDYGASVERAQRRVSVAMDLAAGQNMSLETATFLLAKASQGATETLQRYGIVIDDTVPKAQRLEMAMRQIEERFGGAAQEKMNTALGQWRLLANNVGDLAEEFYNLHIALELEQDLDNVNNAVSNAAEGMALGISATEMLALNVRALGQALADVSPSFKALYDLFYDDSLGEAFIKAADALQKTPPVPLPEVAGEKKRTTEEIEATWNRLVEQAMTYEMTEEEIAGLESQRLKQSLKDWQYWVDEYKAILDEAEEAEIGMAERAAQRDIDANQRRLDAINNNIADLTRATEQSAQDREDAEVAAAERSQQAWGQFAGDFMSTLLDMEATTEDILKSMARAFINLLFNVVLKAQGGFVGAFLSAFKFWDVAENDAALIREGRRAAMFIQQGMTQGMASFNMAPALAMSGGGSPQIPNRVIHNHYHFGNVNDETTFRARYMPVIEQATREGHSTLKVSTRNVTGGPDGEFV